MQGIGKFDMKTTVIPNGLEKSMVFIQLIKNWFLLTACSLRIQKGPDELVKNLLNNNFKHLSQEFSSEFVNLVKQKGVYPYEYMENF